MRPAPILLLLGLAACQPGPDSAPPEQPGDSQAPGESAPPDSPPADSEDSVVPGDSGDSGDTHDTGEQPGTVEQLDPFVEAAVRFSPDPLVPGEPVTVRYEGALAGSHALQLRYGLDAAYPVWTELMSAVEGGYEVSVDIPADGLAIHVAFEEPKGEAEDDNGGLYWHAGADFPYLGPWLSWSETALPGDGIVVSWETTQPCLGVVEYGSSEALGSWAVGGLTDTVHHVEIVDLEPGETLHYRVWDSALRVSETFTYAVPDTTQPFSFVVMSDLQPWGVGGRLLDTVEEILAGHSEAAFALMVGDIAGMDHPSSWWVSLHTSRALWPGLPMVPLPGNHERYAGSGEVWGFDRYLAPPYASVDEPWYSVDFGGTHILALDSGDHGTLDSGGAQHGFVQADLAGCWVGEVRSCDLVLVAFHVPPYNVGMRHFYEQRDLRGVTALFDGSVDWHFAGHEHLYQRTLPLRHEATIAPSGAYGIGPDDGVGYIVLPTSGSSPGAAVIDPEDMDAGARELLAFPVLAPDATSVESELGFVTVDVQGGDALIQAWATGPSSEAQPAQLLESFAYSRP